MTKTTMKFHKATKQFAARALWCASAAVLLFCGMPRSANAQVSLGGHIGAFFPLVTHDTVGGTTSLADQFSIAIPFGVTVKGPGRVAFDMEVAPGITQALHGGGQSTNVSLHPGFLFGLGNGFTFGMRALFDVPSSDVGFIPLINKSWPIHDSFLKAYFVEGDLPVVFNRPPGGPSSNAVTFGVHFGVGF